MPSYYILSRRTEVVRSDSALCTNVPFLPAAAELHHRSSSCPFLHRSFGGYPSNNEHTQVMEVTLLTTNDVGVSFLTANMITSRVFSGLPFSGFSSFRAFENFVRVFGSGLGLFYSSKICKFKTENAISFLTSV